MITITKQIFFTRSERGRRRIDDRPPPSQLVPQGRIPRVSRVMALAIQFDALWREGTVANTVELARLAHVTQPRITQVLNLLHLAPDIQEEILFLPLVLCGHDPIHEKTLRPISAQISFDTQRKMWSKIKRNASTSSE